MSRSVEDLPDEILIEIIGNLPYQLNDYLSLKLVSSRWVNVINCYFKSISHLVQLDRLNYRSYRDLGIGHDLVTKDGLNVIIPDNRPELFISCMELLPNLKAISVNFLGDTKKDKETLYNYLNTRPKITYLDLNYAGYQQNDVKLENIQNFALRDGQISYEDALNRLFQTDHELTQLYMNISTSSNLPFGDGLSVLKRMPTLKMFSHQIHCFNDCSRFRGGTDPLIYTKQPGLSFENLESYSFSADHACFLKHVDNLVACCPNLKNIDCSLNINKAHVNENFWFDNLRAHTNVENLVIRSIETRWELALEVLKMFPMVKNLKLADIKGLNHNEISEVVLKLPSLSLLYLRCLNEFPKYHQDKGIVQVDCMALKAEYSSKYGRALQIVKRDRNTSYEEFPFKRGLNFMQNVFWSDLPVRLLTA